MNWGRRRADQRKIPPLDNTPESPAQDSGQTDWAPIQAVDTAPDAGQDDSLAIPEPDAPLHMEIPLEDSVSGEEHGESEKPATPSETHAPRIFAFLGASGGVGTTSLAVQFAQELTRQANADRPSRYVSDPSVCLIDLDFETGSCGRHLDLLPGLKLSDLTTPNMQIDPAFTSASVSTHSSGFCLLALPNTPQGGRQVSGQAIAVLLDAAMDLYDHIVIDMPRAQESWSDAVLAGADRVCVLSELTVPSLHAGRAQLSRLRALKSETMQHSAVIAKHERRSFRNALKITDAQKALGEAISGTLSLDPETAREALNCGEPFGVVRPDSRYVKDVRALVQSLQNPRIARQTRAA